MSTSTSTGGGGEVDISVFKSGRVQNIHVPVNPKMLKLINTGNLCICTQKYHTMRKGFKHVEFPYKS